MGNVALLKAAIAFFAVAMVLSLLSLKYKKPEGKWFAPVWRMKENYERPGILLYVASLVFLVVGFGLYLAGRP